ncbi:Golgi SNAP receptor complex member 2-like [Clavelina lepadiformis]|uniref:Golgi SNAP receptor complex member 2 n=1 Tax=Clavelina lepadiformis TaxID=159417 RepID=A0ABP0F0V6_CLALP
METLYHQTNRMISDVQRNLGRLETATGHEAFAIENAVHSQLEQINGNCDRLEVLVNKEPPSRRQNARMRVDQVRYDVQHIQSALRQFQHRQSVRDQQRKERDLLLRTSFKTNDEENTTIEINSDMNHHTGLSNAHKGLDDIISHGSSVLDNLRSQRGMLKGVKTRMLNIANTLGLSNTVMRLIEKRTTQDKLILFGGMFVTSLIMFLLWKYYT